MQKARFLALLLVVSMVVSMVVLPAYAESDYTMTLTADKEVVAPGGTVTLTLATTGENPGVAAVGAVIHYPAGWTLSNVSDSAASVFTGVSLLPLHSDNGAGTYTMYWGIAGQLATATGTLATLTFTAPANAEAGECAFTLENGTELNQTGTLENGSLVLGSLRDVDIAFAGCAVTVATSTGVPTYCEKCGPVAAENWTEWTGQSFETGKHYYMTSDVYLTSRAAAAVNMCLDLCGFDIYGPQGTAANSGQVLRIVSGAQVAVMSSKDGGAMIARGEYNNNDNGGNIYVSSTGTRAEFYNVELADGTVLGGKHGGNVFANMGSVYFEGCTFTNGSANTGGNVYINSSVTTAEFVDCAFTGGNATGTTANTDGRGGNILVTGSRSANPVVTFTNCSITGGTAAGWGNTKGLYSGGLCTIDLNNVEAEFVNVSANTTLNVNGGTYGTVYSAASSTINVYNGSIGDLTGKNGTVNVYQCIISQVTSTDSNPIAATVAACAQQTAVGTTGKLVAHAPGTCATCGHTFAAPGSTVQCATCNAVHESMQGAWLGGDIAEGSYRLMGDLTVDAVQVDGTLDLNGHTLTVDGELDARIGNIVDSKGTGKIVGTAKFNQDNTMLPVTADGGYVLETVPLVKGFYGGDYAPGAESAQYAFYIDKAAADTKMNEALAAGTLVLEVYVKWQDSEGVHQKIFQLSDSMVAFYAQEVAWDINMLALKLTMAEGATILACTAQVTSNGVTVG